MILLAGVAGGAACGGGRESASTASPTAATRTPGSTRAPQVPTASPEETVASPEGTVARPGDAAGACDAVVASCFERMAGARSRGEACRWDHECRVLESPCGGCAASVAASELVATRGRFAEVRARLEAEAAALGSGACAERTRHCAPSEAVCREGRCTVRPLEERVAAAEARVEVPPGNAPDAEEPPRPPPGEADARARRLFEAIVHDDPERAADFYFPREAFLALKGIADPGGYWDRLFRRYLEDIHVLHRTLPDLERAEFERLELVRRGGWVRVREEGNVLPYWVSRHSRLHYRVDGEPRAFEVRVLITWGSDWYVTHLREFR